MSGKIYAPLISKELSGDPSNSANSYADISGSQFGPNKRIIDASSPAAAVVTDSTSTAGTTYVGIAAPGTLTTQASWQIFKIVLTSNNATLIYADGDDAFDNIWNNRTGLSYS